MAKTKEELDRAWSKIVAKAWTDEEFKEKLMNDPTETLKELGFEFQPGQKIELHEQGGRVVHLIFPNKPEGELSETELKKVAAGVSRWPREASDYRW